MAVLRRAIPFWELEAQTRTAPRPQEVVQQASGYSALATLTPESVSQMKHCSKGYPRASPETLNLRTAFSPSSDSADRSTYALPPRLHEDKPRTPTGRLPERRRPKP
jgi:hypothetical protein